MAHIIGTAASSFTGKDGNRVEGLNLYLTEPIAIDRGTGLSAEKVFLSKAKLAGLSFTPCVDQDITVLYNRWGSIATVILDDVAID